MVDDRESVLLAQLSEEYEYISQHEFVNQNDDFVQRLMTVLSELPDIPLHSFVPNNTITDNLSDEWHYLDDILASFVLRGDNLELHAKGGQTVWAPIVQASAHALLLPVYGLDINPFLFLFTELRARHEKDWFRIANNRERRWIEEIERLFEGARWQTHRKNLRLRAGGKPRRQGIRFHRCLLRLKKAQRGAGEKF